MRRTGGGAILLATPGLLAACGGIEGSANKPTKAPTSVNHPKGPIDELSISNWPLYIDKQTNKDFQAQFDVGDFKYTEDVNDNEEFFGKVRQPLASGEPIGRDLMVLTDWMAARMLTLGYLEPIDKDNIPNFKNLQPGLRGPVWDPERQYSLPWQSGMTAIGVNTKETGGPISSYQDFFDPKFKGRISMFIDPRDAVNFIMLRDGIDPARRASTTCSRRSTRSTSSTATVRSGASPATTTRRTSRAGTWRWRRPTRATSSSSSRPTPTSVHHPRGGRDAVVGQHADPGGGG